MDTIQNLKAFLAVARLGSFSAVAREAGLATSVVAKRVDQLETTARIRLFERSTRRVTLTEAGHRWLGRVRAIVGDVDDLMAEARRSRLDLEGALRVKLPTSLAILYLGDVLGRFQQRHPKIAMDLVLTDRALNPIDEGFDLAVSVFATAFSNVRDVPLCPLRRVLCASQGYLDASGMPRHPRDLAEHDILNFQPTGETWTFTGPRGPVAIDVHPRLSANDGQVLLAAAKAGAGIALLADYVALPALRSGSLLPVLEEFALPEFWIKALVPENRLMVPRVRALIDCLAENLIAPPWAQ